MIARTQAFYNDLEMRQVAAADFIKEVETQIQHEHEDLEAQIEALTAISQRRVQEHMDRRADAINERQAILATMAGLVGK